MINNSIRLESKINDASEHLKSLETHHEVSLNKISIVRDEIFTNNEKLNSRNSNMKLE